MLAHIAGNIFGRSSLNEEGEQFDIHPNQITQWKSQLLEGAVGFFGGDATADSATVVVDLKTLHANICALALEKNF